MTFAAFRDAVYTLTPHLLLCHEVRVAKTRGGRDQRNNQKSTQPVQSCSTPIGLRLRSRITQLLLHSES